MLMMKGAVNMGFAIRAAWYGTDLGDVRPCRGIYERYPYDTLPPLDSSQFTGEFQWLGGLGGEVDPWQCEKMQALDEELAAKDMALPHDFINFSIPSNLRDALGKVSVTAGYGGSDWLLHSPIEHGAYLLPIRLHGYANWYLYWRPSGHVFVVNSHLDYESEYEAESLPAYYKPESDLSDRAAQRAAIFWLLPLLSTSPTGSGLRTASGAPSTATAQSHSTPQCRHILTITRTRRLTGSKRIKARQRSTRRRPSL
ncbi:hypothetical protein [Streptomyces sp. NPDC093149]|uniref:hypothetical protein n=1 Tax=Streptomyces sp. NPDC093149 TaxID=3366031 RepID=UPI00382F1CE3